MSVTYRLIWKVRGSVGGHGEAFRLTQESCSKYVHTDEVEPRSSLPQKIPDALCRVTGKLGDGPSGGTAMSEP